MARTKQTAQKAKGNSGKGRVKKAIKKAIKKADPEADPKTKKLTTACFITDSGKYTAANRNQSNQGLWFHDKPKKLMDATELARYNRIDAKAWNSVQNRTNKEILEAKFPGRVNPVRRAQNIVNNNQYQETIHAQCHINYETGFLGKVRRGETRLSRGGAIICVNDVMDALAKLLPWTASCHMIMTNAKTQKIPLDHWVCVLYNILKSIECKDPMMAYIECWKQYSEAQGVWHQDSTSTYWYPVTCKHGEMLAIASNSFGVHRTIEGVKSMDKYHFGCAKTRSLLDAIHNARR